MQADRPHRIARRIAVSVLSVVLLLVLASAAITALPGGAAPLPAVIWVKGTESVMDLDLEDREVRIGSAQGSALGEVEQISVFTGWGPSEDQHRDGVSIRRPRTTVERRQRDLARLGLIPFHRKVAAGYEASGKTVEVDGEVWREFRLFDPEFGYTQLGWWPW